MRKDKIKILMVHTANMNLGDTILADNNYYLMKKALKNRKHDILKYSIFSRDLGQVKYVDAVVFASGIIKVTTENLWLYIPELLREAQKYNVPVFLSAMGVEAFYPDDERSIEFKNALNLDCVKGISVRDDVETLKRDYITNPNIKIYAVHDHAVWCAETYKKELSNVEGYEEDVIGLGIVRHKLFEDYGHPEITKQFQLDFWKDVVAELEKRNMRWVAFTNGDTYDELFAKEVLDYIGHGDKVEAPRDSAHLVQIISTFKGVIAGRMHSNIVSYSLGIPSIGFIWNQKLTFWGERIGHPERFLKTDEMTAEKAVESLLVAMTEETGPQDEQKNPVYLALKNFIDNWCKPHKRKLNFTRYEKKLIAHALGGIELRYKNTNTIEAFDYSFENGYKNYQLDLRLTSDGALVCVNRWHPDTYKIMNMSREEGEENKPLSLAEFKRCKYYNRFETVTFEEFLNAKASIIKSNNLKFVFSLGRPSKDDLAIISEQFAELLATHKMDNKSHIIRVERKSDVNNLRNLEGKVEFMYHFVDPKLSEEKTLEAFEDILKYCKQQKIKYISMNPDLYTDRIAALCKKYSGIRVCIFTLMRTDRIVDAIQRGAYMVGSHYYGVEYLNRLIKK